MLQPKSASVPPAVATGILAARPLAHLLVYARERALSGTFGLVAESGHRGAIVVSRGLVSRIAMTEPVAYLGNILFETGVIDGGELSASLAEMASTKRLHGQILLAKGLIDEDQLGEALHLQRARKLAHLFTMPPRTAFSFYSDVDLVGERTNDVAPMDPLPLIWRGVRTSPAWEHVRTTLATIGARQLRARGSLEDVGLSGKELHAARLLGDGACTVSELAARSGLETHAADLLAYFLVITKLAEIVDPQATQTSALRRPVTSPGFAASLGQTLPSGEYVRRISFTMTAVDAGSHPLRIPSPFGAITPQAVPPRRRESPVPSALSPSSSRISAVRPRATLGAPDRTGGPEGEQALSEAEAHLMKGDRARAVAFARKALALEPGMAAATAFLAYVEALGAGPGKDAYLVDLLKMIDVAVLREEGCRRGRFYRAEIKKRLGDHDGAIRDLRAAIRNDPDDADAHAELDTYERKVRDGTVALRPPPQPRERAVTVDATREKK